MPRVYLFLCLWAVVFLCNESASASVGVVTDVIDPDRGRTAVFALYAGDTVVKNDGQYALCSANGARVARFGWRWGMINEDQAVQGLGGVTVQLYRANDSFAAETTTKKDGSYTFKVEPGTTPILHLELTLRNPPLKPILASKASTMSRRPAPRTTGPASCTPRRRPGSTP